MKTVRVSFKGVAAIASLALSLFFIDGARAESIDPGLVAKIQAATFEVVAAKPENDPLSYEKPLPLELLPFQERNDKYYSIGTAFAIGQNLYVTAGHVFQPLMGGLWGAPALRDGSGKVYAVAKIEKFSLDRDFVVFSLASPPDIVPFETNSSPELNSVVYSVGNALGTGIVLRDGLYTSNTPEDQDGRWNFIRFSAAASPGNSGGPLLDRNGKVVGVVLRKSPNENLNYALPIGEVLKAPDHVAEADSRLTYRIGVMDTVQIGIFKMRFSLPLDFADFAVAFLAQQDAFADRQLADLLKKDSDRLFPNGAGSQRLLHGLATLNTYPSLVSRNGDGIWNLFAKPENKTPLAGNGYVQLGVAGGNLMFHWHRPDSVSAKQAYDTPDRLIGDLLQSGFLHRIVASEQVKINALGKPAEETIHTDRWLRRWQVRIWPLAYANMLFVTFALPVPDGYDVIAQIVPAGQRHDHIIGMQAQTDFIEAAYEGTLTQWKDFLGEKGLLPSLFTRVKADFTKDGGFAYASDRARFSVAPEVEAVTPQSVLTLGLGWFGDSGNVVWDSSIIRLKRTADDNDWLNVQRHIKPSEGLDQSLASEWEKIVQRQHPFDAVIRTENDITKITGVLASPAEGESAPLYTAFIGVSGVTTQDVMKAKLDVWLKDFRVTEH